MWSLLRRTLRMPFLHWTWSYVYCVIFKSWISKECKWFHSMWLAKIQLCLGSEVCKSGLIRWFHKIFMFRIGVLLQRSSLSFQLNSSTMPLLSCLALPAGTLRGETMAERAYYWSGHRHCDSTVLLSLFIVLTALTGLIDRALCDPAGLLVKTPLEWQFYFQWRICVGEEEGSLRAIQSLVLSLFQCLALMFCSILKWPHKQLHLTLALWEKHNESCCSGSIVNMHHPRI